MRVKLCEKYKIEREEICKKIIFNSKWTKEQFIKANSGGPLMNIFNKFTIR